LTNITSTNVTIHSLRTSCGCTVVRAPAIPWTIGPGSNGTFDVDVDLRGKIGVLTKTITVDSSAGYRVLTVRVGIPSAGRAPSTTAADRARNMQVAMVDRQAVFKGDCSACHLQQAIGKKEGNELYSALCGICHDAEHRASMVPNLRALNRQTDRDFWLNIIRHGKPDTLMPAFAISEGGPLTDAQIMALAEFVSGPAFHAQPIEVE
jgi:mono/diheme cytochrome c family protein